MAQKIWFGSLAVEMIQDSGRTVAEVADAVGRTPRNQFSKWKAGRWTYIAPAKLRRIIDVVAGRDAEKRKALQIAYLVDMTLDEFRPLISIVPTAGDEKAETAGTKFPEALREKLEDVGKAYSQDPDFMALANSLFTYARTLAKRAAEKGQ